MFHAVSEKCYLCTQLRVKNENSVLKSFFPNDILYLTICIYHSYYSKLSLNVGNLKIKGKVKTLESELIF